VPNSKIIKKYVSANIEKEEAQQAAAPLLHARREIETLSL